MSLPNTAHWQPALEGEGFVEDVEDILQCVNNVLTTPKGSQPLRLDFGSNIYLYVDYPVNKARPHIVREAFECLHQWIVRAKPVKVEVFLEGDSQFVVKPYLELESGLVISTEVRP